jgi:hypothetical protein
VRDSARELIRGETVLLKTFFVGIVLGLVAAGGVLYAIPAVDQEREASIVTVSPNGGNAEVFHINIPHDRVMVGAPAQNVAVPPGMTWPSDEILAGVRAEIFKIRNARDTVVGVAVRAAAQHDGSDVIDWVLHLPARGSLFVNMEIAPRESGYRLGEIRSGSREFAEFSGVMTERWVVSRSTEEDAPAGRIELQASYIGKLEPQEPLEPVE